ncbi:bifunctional 4-hydroxy-2-oxoglutarate aldolase/2-dehydro-3-deoxy-phosphogluconate aldolase [Tuanshanicoccus lijuaniae]|uniref:bifunctional 4-hydroxy-2-oxoglutarate aldolase/2-dehydro-3-deoxy-phosphogluconate aldolase n=1 Tax=Aerococcaceae bacterium zg-1292 TaxID=2774330 RepID=UPI0019351037|nr:bifunctional 4-hydroxy-2-oxoglutarate aldolase/2-dehydro-3-deoxy-phosphogluconate aldolase [Aerococcaceae bacterium zg-1292]MBF6626436.1 bifunctional 4-hydroxy-2-oxoglutarate aldolase/2-dehydro-3-deoxy-phosphogluconate aldolase [Aerococcaceae bacterium zg-BR9]MBF6979203.1 bifunctional 4-hydroxy-2-oxoglutarate aldolase/2-dehydro-3-deoxy-phosphogluconate aldolase [Aerococcaceae bacterium zg-BR22]QQA37112.1 bifunctional 4-hydroxy-2-oxoglutarate aldolase/2-dehydro-3-deoxy-phosphogluconate aldolas
MLEQLQKNYFFAVIRGKDEHDAIEIARHAIKGGIRNIEITFSTPNATKVMTQLSEEFADDSSVIIGAGTVMSTELAEQAIAAGAKFLVSPHFSQDIQTVAQAHENLYFPGCATATEIVTASEAGCPIIKLFPGGVLGPGFIKDIHGPIPEVNLMPSGGVSLDNVAAWKKAGACAVGIGSALASKVATDGYNSVTEIAEAFVKAAGDEPNV